MEQAGLGRMGRKRLAISASIAGLVVLAVAFSPLVLPGGDEGAGRLAPPTFDVMAASLGTDVMTALTRGRVPGRSGDIVLVPKPNRFIVGEKDVCGVRHGEPFTETSHAAPWNYLTRVPLAFYGPAIVPEGQAVFRPVDLAGVAPTVAEIIGLKGWETDAPAFDEVLTGRNGRRPKIVVTVVLDGGGWNVLQAHPTAWPNIARLLAGGTVYYNASTGTAPALTGPTLATLGTGRYPNSHGLSGNQLRTPEGTLVDAWGEDGDPSYLRTGTLGDIYDRREGNGSTQAVIGAEGWHLGLLGRGAGGIGADQDLAALWDRERAMWWANEQFYRLPAALPTDVARLVRYERELDLDDRIADGRWFGRTPEQLAAPDTRVATPAFARFTGDAAVQLLRTEPFGPDDTTDLLSVEFVSPDQAGHLWNAVRPEVASVLAEVDRQVARLVEELDRLVGRGGYVLVLTADHGQQPLPELAGGWRIDRGQLERDIESRFGDVVQRVTASDVYLTASAQRSVDATAIARFIASYTIGDNVTGRTVGSVPEDRLSETLFAAAFPAGFLDGLGAQQLAALGTGSYPESNFTSAVPEG